MALNFQQFAAEGERFLKELADGLGYPEDRNRAARVLRSVLHTLRDLITPEENVEFIAQMPMFLKAVYIEGWTLKQQEGHIRTIDQLITAVRMHHGIGSERDFEDDDAIEVAISMVIMSLRKYISLGELEDIRAVLPQRLKPILNQVLML